MHKAAPRQLTRKHSKLGGPFSVVSSGKAASFQNTSVDQSNTQNAFSAGQPRGSVGKGFVSQDLGLTFRKTG